MTRRHLIRTLTGGAVLGRAKAIDGRAWSRAEPQMGCLWTLTLPDLAPASAETAGQAVFTEIARLNGIFSDYETTSELNRLCLKAGQDKLVPVSAELFDILERSYALAAFSSGIFDITLGPCTRLWRRSRRRGELPDKDTLARARALCGWQAMELDAKSRSVRLTKAGMQLDLGGIAKGWTQDACLKLLRERFGIIAVLLDAAGQVAAGTPPTGRLHWKIALQAVPTGMPGQIRLREANVATSGDHYQFVEIGGSRYSHLIDPRTGLGSTISRQGTLIASTGALADGLTKLLCLLEPDASLALIKSKYPEVQARVTESIPARKLLVRETEGFPAMEN